jgi:hypothetical protein
MFAMSVNDVPGWLVTIPPRAMGVPVAATPGLVPQEVVLTAALVPDALVAGVLELVLEPELVLLELVLLELVLLELVLLHPAAAMAMAAARTRVLRFLI